jgi:hypothetical protein
MEELSLKDLITNLLKILADNNRVLKLFKDPAIHSQAKHLDVKYHWQCQEIKQKSITITYISSNLNGVDRLIKPKDSGLYYTFKNLIWVIKLNNLTAYTNNNSGYNRDRMDISS